MMKSVAALLFLFFCTNKVYSQTNFRLQFEANNPVPLDSVLPIEERLRLHKTYQEKNKNQTISQVNSNLYIFYDYLIVQDYTNASQYLLNAEAIAEKSGNKDWQGWVAHRKGILYTALFEDQKSLDAYTKAAELCRQAGDSLCLAESLEQMSVMNGKLGNYTEAQKYFEQAKPMIEKFGGQKQLAAMLSNYGITLSNQGKVAEGLTYYRQALNIYSRNDYFREQAKAMNNLADAYRRLGKLDSSYAILQECIRINTARDFRGNLIKNYQGIYAVMEEMGNYKVALEYYIKYSELRDSLTGNDTKAAITALESKYKMSQKELELQQSKADLLSARQYIERGIGVIILLLMLGIILFWSWRLKARWLKEELAQNKDNLTIMTRLLLEKNTRISELEEIVESKPAEEIEKPEEDDFSENLYNRRILTDEDWSSFKIYFEKSYPGYLQKLRKSSSGISEAEERLFLFIKLNLTNKEAAAILGISADSIKKTRTRLRKRLELDQETSLDEYIKGF